MEFKLLLVFAFIAVSTATVHFSDRFEDESWEKRWVYSTSKGSQAGKFKLSSGKFYGDKDKDLGIQTSEDARFYQLTSKIATPFSSKGKKLVVQFTVKHEQNIDCGGGYIKLFPADLKPESMSGDSPYFVMFGPDICGPGTKRVHVIFTYKGTNLLTKKDIRCKDDEFTHLYTLIVNPEGTYEVRIDNEKVESGDLEADWDFLAPKKIKDPEAKKPEDWDDRAKIDDPDDKKPEDYDKPELIADPEAKKPADWDNDEDGEWEPPMISNPEYKGEWKPKQIDNPAYKGEWVHPEIDNPDYKPDTELAQFDNIGHVGFELWQVKSGTIFDNILVTDDVAEAEKEAKELFEVTKEDEKKMKDKQDEEDRKKQEEEEKKKKEEEERKRKEEEQRKAKELEIQPITLQSHDPSLKQRQSAVIRTLYDPLALQCKNCGLRYAVTETMAFSAHLDWHFRMRRRERDNARRAQGRAWYFERIDWIISEEIEDDEKDLADPDGAKGSPDSSEMSTVAVSQDPETARAQSTCPICNEDFDQFFKQEDGRWHYANAILVDGKVYHPACYKDFEAQGKADQVLQEVEMEDEEKPKAEEESEVKAEVKDEKVEAAEAAKQEDEAGGEDAEMKEGEAAKAAEVKEEPMETEDGAEAVRPKENGENAEEGGEKADAETAVKSEPAEEQNPDAESAAQETKEKAAEEVKEEPKDQEEEKEQQPEAAADAEVEEKDRSLTDPSLEEQKPAAMAAPPPVADIKFNITTKVERLERRESTVSTSESESASSSEFDADAVVQEARPELAERKPKLKGRALTVLPAQNKDSEMSGLCSIM